jgi:hypothetical protein
MSEKLNERRNVTVAEVEEIIEQIEDVKSATPSQAAQYQLSQAVRCMEKAAAQIETERRLDRPERNPTTGRRTTHQPGPYPG